jgi:hypothetical protein
LAKLTDTWYEAFMEGVQIYRLINMYWPPGRLIFAFVETFELKFKSIIKKERKNISKLYRAYHH